MLAVTKENGVHESHITRFLCKRRFLFFGGIELPPELELFLFQICVK
jgi:hypothetical protein